MAFVIREGDPTTTDGFVIAASASATVQQRKLARMGDPVWCPACDSVGYIAEGNPTFIDQYVAVATHGQAVQCACPSGCHRLIATQDSLRADMEATISIPSEHAETAQAAAEQLTRSIHDGSLREKLFSPIQLADQPCPAASSKLCNSTNCRVNL